jgi:hypothetical protein
MNQNDVNDGRLHDAHWRNIAWAMLVPYWFEGTLYGRDETSRNALRAFAALIVV